MKDRIQKQFEISQENGWWIASTPTRDRQDDRVVPTGLDIANYRKNPVVIWAHDYRSPFAVIGKAVDMQATEQDFRIKPEWREPTNDNDPMNIIQALIDQGLVKTLSIGFRPLEWEENEFGGFDFTKAEILEVSAVPVPANQEALRLAVKGLTSPDNTEPSDEPDVPQDEVPDAPKSVDSTEANQATNDDTNELTPEELSVLAELTQALKQLKEKYDV